MIPDMKDYLEWRELCKPIEELTGLRAHAYSPAVIIFYDEGNGRDYEIPVPFLRVLCAALQSD